VNQPDQERSGQTGRKTDSEGSYYKTTSEEPGGFFKNPFISLAFLGLMAFLLSPILGILWAARAKKKAT